MKGRGETEWVEVVVKKGVKALVLLNLQSYAGGRDLWGLKDHKKDEQKGWKNPIFNDGLIEVLLMLPVLHPSSSSTASSLVGLAACTPCLHGCKIMLPIVCHILVCTQLSRQDHRS